MTESELIQIAQEYPYTYKYVKYLYDLGFNQKDKLKLALDLSHSSFFRPEIIIDMLAGTGGECGEDDKEAAGIIQEHEGGNSGTEI